MADPSEAIEQRVPAPAEVELLDRGPRYTETPPDPYARNAPFIAEPWNAVTASFFIFIAIAWLVRLRGRFRDYPFLTACLPVLLAGGIGGTLYHGLRTERAYFLLDVVPIQLLAFAGAVYIAIRLWKKRGWLYLGGATLVFLGLWSLIVKFISPWNRHLAINMSYASLAAMVVAPIAVLLIRTRFRHGPWIAAGVVAFAIAWFFRLYDRYAGASLPMGTHWLWHTFGAISTALVIEFFYKVEGEGKKTASPPANADGL